MSLVDMTGQKCYRLTVLGRYEGKSKGEARWVCLCDCGKKTIVRGTYLRNGHTKTCGSCITYSVQGDIVTGTVKTGRKFIFDKADFPIVKKYKWSVDSSGYARGTGPNGRSVKLHRLLLGEPKGKVVDHINGKPWDCRRCNLRAISQHDNTKNSSIHSNNRTGFKGVCWDKRKGKYLSSIHPNGKTKFIGYYSNPIEAAHAYDRAALFYYGEFARTNFAIGGSNEKT